MTPVCGEVCHHKAFESVRGNWIENMRAWMEGNSEDRPTHAPGTKMRDVRFTFIFPTGQRNLVYTHALPARLCANADDKDNKAVQRDIKDEMRHISRLHAAECEEVLYVFACETCGAPGKHIIQMPLPVLNMPVPTVGVSVMPVCGKPGCATEIQDSTAATMQEMRDIFSPMYGQHSPALSMLRCDSCGEWGKLKKCQGCGKVAYCDKECQRAAWKRHKTVCRA